MVETLPLGRFHHQRLDLKRWFPTFLSSHKTLFTVLWIAAFASVFVWQRNIVDGFSIFKRVPVRAMPKLRPVAFNLTDFGAVGDGVTLNTEAFEKAVLAISKLGKKGGGQLNVPPGRWLTAPFNLTSHMTLFLAEDAEILGIQDEKYWPLMPPLPSYGYGREHPGPRYGSLIHGQNLKDIVITGHNGTINGQGQTWWKKYRQKLLNHTRGPLVQIMWNVTILAPVVEAPNTDGIDPDSCEDMVIEDCYISVGDDGIAIKSGWDQYGISYRRPSKNILIRNLVVRSMVRGEPFSSSAGYVFHWSAEGNRNNKKEEVKRVRRIASLSKLLSGKRGMVSSSVLSRTLLSILPVRFSAQCWVPYSSNCTITRSYPWLKCNSAGVSIGSEMSGGVSNVTVENVLVWSSRRAVRIKTAPGRGGYVRHITYRNLTFDNVRVGIVIKTDYNEHPDEGYDPKALPVLEDISFTSVHGQGVRVPVRIHGSEEIPVRNVTFRDMSVGLTYKKKHIFQCAFVQGRVIGTIFPAPCENLDRYDEQGKLVKHSASQNMTDIDYDF
ncbi:unnamed protein product [Prunus armeniaca]|uniref:Pectate lyase superfamily protein domain-containing protein n=1 Tax=Prunus armeniaca TaxID=36596 RepID=A0A6J5XXA0_PRUAR|nr:unnamed protein product [Prunus armeniaca]